MKKVIFSLVFAFSFMFANTVLADATECFSKETAELLAKKSLNQYIVGYCDCCADVGGKALATLVYVKSTKVVECRYDENSYSVEMEFDVTGTFNVLEKKPDNASFEVTQTSKMSNILSLDYHFFFANGKASRLFDLVDVKNPNTPCSSLTTFPKVTGVEAYSKWRNKMGKK